MTYTLQRDNAERDLKALRELLDPGRLIVPARETFEVLRELRDSIEEQVKPAIEEPTEFGSLIRAAAPHHYRALWTPSPTSGDHYWMSEKGYVEVWSGLTDVEVLRVGLGPEQLAEWETDLLNQQARRDTAAAVLSAMDVDQYLIDAVANARPR